MQAFAAKACESGVWPMILRFAVSCLPFQKPHVLATLKQMLASVRNHLGATNLS